MSIQIQIVEKVMLDRGKRSSLPFIQGREVSPGLLAAFTIRWLPSSLWHGHPSGSTTEAQPKGNHEGVAFRPGRRLCKHKRNRAAYSIAVFP